MIFDTTRFIDERLNKIASEIEQNEVGLRVICGNVYKFPCVKLVVSIFINEPRRFNLLEDFILRAADELKPPVIHTDLATVFGLDPIFISTTCQELEKFNVIALNHRDGISLTDIGREYYRKGYIPRPAEIREVSLVYTSLHGKVFISDKLPDIEPTDSYLPGLPINPGLEETAKSSVTLQSVTEAATNAGLGWHAPEVGKAITGIGEIKSASQMEFGIGVFILQDTVVSSEDFSSVSIRAYNFQSTQRESSIEHYLQEKQKQNHNYYTYILPVDDKDEILRELVEPEQLNASNIYKKDIIDVYREQKLRERKEKETVSSKQAKKEAENLSVEKVNVEYLWGEKIRPRFIQSIKEANHTLMIMSPWITEEVVDEEFLGYLKNLAQKKVACVIGWGIAREKEREERLPSPKVLSSLNSIQTPQGIPAVTVWWLGNFHNKECIVDYRMSLSGSQNWLSYRGDRSPRGESVYYTTVPDLIKQALDANEQLFIKAVRSVWKVNVNSLYRNIQELERCCVAWTALRKPGIALNQIAELIPLYRPKGLPAITKLIDVVYMTLTRLPNNELSKLGFVPEVINTETKIAESSSNYSELRDRSNLARYLGRFAKANQDAFLEAVTKQANQMALIGLLNENTDPYVLIAQLSRFTEEKKNIPLEKSR